MAGGKTVAAQRDAWICFEDEAGQTLRPPKARTWGRRGHTPVIPVSGKGSSRVSIAGLTCYRPGERSRLIYRTIVHRNRKGERRSFSERDYMDLLDATHQQLDAPIVVIWVNPAEAVWSHLKRSIGNLAVTGVDHLQAIIKNQLGRIQYRTDLLDGFLAHTGLTLEPQTT